MGNSGSISRITGKKDVDLGVEMKACSGEWDVRCPAQLRKLFPKRRGYYFRVSREKAIKVLNILTRAYHVPAPAIDKMPRGTTQFAMYDYQSRTVFIHPRTHIKSLFHEFYHHLDNMTGGKYDSDDGGGGPSSLAWIFAEKLWKKFTGSGQGKGRTSTAPLISEALPIFPKNGFSDENTFWRSAMKKSSRKTRLPGGTTGHASAHRRTAKSPEPDQDGSLRRPKRGGCSGGGGGGGRGSGPISVAGIRG
jgi:hypothetical protein